MRIRRMRMRRIRRKRSIRKRSIRKRYKAIKQHDRSGDARRKVGSIEGGMKDE